MGRWVVSFEALWVGFFLLLLGLLVHRRDAPRLFELLAATGFGLLLETANVWVLHPYEYHPLFVLQIGAVPSNTPVCIGLGWGLLVFCSMEISDRLALSETGRVLLDALVCVLFDLAMDMVAIRLDGGLWNWPDMPKTLEITAEGLYGVGWQNYLGWYFAIFVISALIRLARTRLHGPACGKRAVAALLLPVLGCLCVAPILLFPVLVHRLLGVDAQRVRMVLFFGMMGLSVAAPGWELLRARPGRTARRARSLFTRAFFFSIYAYVLGAMIAIGIARRIPVYFGLCVLFMAGTLALDAASAGFPGRARDRGARPGTRRRPRPGDGA